MTRRHLSFDCEGARLVGTLDAGTASTGLLLVSGGNELRCGAWNGQATIARKIAEHGFPVFRYDHPGVGDSEGANMGFLARGSGIDAAIDAFRQVSPAVSRIIGFGNCDAASSLMLGKGHGLDGLILSNPWTIENDDAAPPPDALRDHYKRRLSDPAALIRLLSGKVSPAKLFTSLRDAMRPAPPPTSLAQDIADGIAGYRGEVSILIADRDRTAQAFLAAWPKDDARIRRCADATHSYVEQHAREWLLGEVLTMLRRDFA